MMEGEKMKNNSTEINPFEFASRMKLRFNSNVGDLTTEQLWDLPLKSGGRGKRASLDDVGRRLLMKMKGYEEESLLEDPSENPAKVADELAIQLVKSIIQTKQEEERHRHNKALNKQKRQKLLKALAQKEEDSILGMSEQEIRDQLVALGSFP
jgi:cytochrome P450